MRLLNEKDPYNNKYKGCVISEYGLETLHASGVVEIPMELSYR